MYNIKHANKYIATYRRFPYICGCVLIVCFAIYSISSQYDAAEPIVAIQHIMNTVQYQYNLPSSNNSIIAHSNTVPIQIYCIDGCMYFHGFFTHVFKSIYGAQFTLRNHYTAPSIFNPTQKQIVIMNTYNNASAIDKRAGNTVVIACNAEPGTNIGTQGFDMIIDDKLSIHLRPQPNTFFMYVPAYILLFWEKRQSSMYDLIKPDDYNAKAILATKTKFCAYIAQKCYYHRTLFFDALSTYKQVDGLGRCNHNVQTPSDRTLYNKNITYQDTAVQQYRDYKFVIAFENTELLGYISEKIVNPMLANSIPIYLGDPHIHQHFNNKSFIDAQYFENYNAIVEFVKYLDQNDDAYLQYLQEPWLPNNEFTPWFPVTEKPDNHIFQQFSSLPSRFWSDIT